LGKQNKGIIRATRKEKLPPRYTHTVKRTMWRMCLGKVKGGEE